MSDKAKVRKLIKSVDVERRFPKNTCPASRHVQMIGEYLAKGQPFMSMDEEPEHCGESLLVTVRALYKSRSRIEADDALIQQALWALEHHQEQTRPINTTIAVINALRARLETSNAS